MSDDFSFVYFGGEPLGVPVLNELEACGLTPSLVVASSDRPVGRKQVMTPPPVKVWAEARDIPVIQPTSFTDSAAPELAPLHELKADVFVVVAYNHILPTWLLELPTHKTVNLHPSLLPLYRGASPIRSAILEDNREAIGVSVMLLDEKMDHGPILEQRDMPIADEDWPIRGPELDEALSNLGGATLAYTLPEWVAGNIYPQEQLHDAATYCGKFTKTDAELTIDPLALPTGDAAYTTLLKIYALMDQPGTWFTYNDTRVKINDAELAPDGSLVITSVTPAGKPAMDWATYLQSLA